ncbi:FxSxx-COOH system tetratricopeptide repeat protein [Streptomyces sp. NPDC093510]|uniref:FxSxx-COOH system tetratricopeptide repeat protein n=1 Tax=Streptomyces sp. NPDC093510 TaxID=3155199 RepID=UPI003444C9D4
MSSAEPAGSLRGGTQATVVTFYSYKGGVGRTMALANVAWLLADAGHRVLVVDWDLESPGLHRYLRPFLRDPELTDSTGVVEMVQEYGRAVEALAAEELPDAEREDRFAELLERHTQVGMHTDSLAYRFSNRAGRIDFLGPGCQDGLYGRRVATFDWSRFYLEQSGRFFAQALRDSLRAEEYDYVLIDSRTGHSDNASLCTLLLPDVVVVGFNFSNQSIEGSAAVARQVREQSAGRIRVLPVPMRVDISHREQAEIRRSRARDQFAGAVGPTLLTGEEQYWREVEVGHLANVAYEEILIPFALQNYERSLQKQAYERLGQEITGDAGLTFAAVAPADRERYVGAFAAVPAAARVVRLVFEPQDLRWADWIRAELFANGVMCEFDRGPGDRAVRGDAAVTYLILMSSAMACSSRLTGMAAHIPNPGELVDRPKVDVAWLEEVEVHPPFRDRPGPRLYTLEEDAARNSLLTHFLPGERRGVPWADRSEAGPRFPGRHPQVWHVPPRRQGEFLGREDCLKQLRNALPPGQAAKRPVVLHGPSGVGKRTYALEFLNRFRADYDIVWWIPADSAESVVRELVLLSERVGASRRSSPRAVDALRELMEGRHGGPERLLLVYDDARHPDEIESLLITSSKVHVLITSENPDWGTLALPVCVEPPSPEEAVRYLRRKSPQLTRELAEQLVAVGETLPQLLDQMAAYLQSTARPPEAVVTELVHAIRNRQAVGLELASAVWQSVTEDLGKERPAALDLLRMLTALSPEGAGWDLLESPASLEFLGLPEGPEGRAQLGFAARGLLSRSQARRGQNGRRLTASRMILSAQRRELEPEEAAELASGVRGVLAAYAPPDDRVDDQDMYPRYAELDLHVESSGAAHDDDLAVRRWLVNQVRYRRLTQCLDAAFSLAQRLERLWTARSAADDRERQLLLLRLRVELANIHTDAGRYPEANRINGAALVELRRLQDLDGEFALRSALGRGGELRALGRPQDALAEDQSVRDILRSKYGPENHFALMAGSNLGLSLDMVGLPNDSLEQHREVHEQRVRVSGELHPLTLRSSVHVGSRLREIGRYDDSLSRLQEIYRLTQTDENLGWSHLTTLLAACSLASTLRHIATLSPGLPPQTRRGKADTARMLDVRAADAFAVYGGPHHPEALVARVGLAADLRFLGQIGGPKGAKALAEENLAAYREWGEDHLFARICEVNLALVLRDAEDESATALSERGLLGLREILYVDPHHPLILAAALCHANMLVYAGDSRAARELDEETHRGLLEKFGPDHPLTLTVAAHLGLREDTSGRADPDNRIGIELDIPKI